MADWSGLSMPASTSGRSRTAGPQNFKHYANIGDIHYLVIIPCGIPLALQSESVTFDTEVAWYRGPPPSMTFNLFANVSGDDVPFTPKAPRAPFTPQQGTWSFIFQRDHYTVPHLAGPPPKEHAETWTVTVTKRKPTDDEVAAIEAQRRAQDEEKEKKTRGEDNALMKSLEGMSF